MTNPQKIEGGWRSRLTFDKDWNTLFIDGKEIVTKQQMVYFISDLLASERQRCVGIANQEGLMFFKEGTTQEEMDRCGRIRKQMRKEIVDKIEQLK